MVFTVPRATFPVVFAVPFTTFPVVFAVPFTTFPVVLAVPPTTFLTPLMMGLPGLPMYFSSPSPSSSPTTRSALVSMTSPMLPRMPSSSLSLLLVLVCMLPEELLLDTFEARSLTRVVDS